ncbi:MAG: hypothetical protein R2736_17200 [Solirubrobacterales bacterium]
MPRIHVSVVSPEEAFNGNAEFWCGRELMAVTVLEDGQLQLRIDPRPDDRPWLLETSSLAASLAEAERLIGSH